MKNTKIMMLVFFLAVGFMSIGCGASLNPNTEGQIQAALEGKKDAFKGCYEEALTKDRDTKGTIGLNLDIGATNGEVEKATPAGGTIKKPSMRQCVAKATDDIKLPEAPGIPVEGKYVIDFSHQ